MHRKILLTCLIALLITVNHLGRAAAASTSIHYDDAVTNGMRMQDALEVAKRCVVAASAFDGASPEEKAELRKSRRNPSQPEPTPDPEQTARDKLKEVRPDDKLVFVGITDKSRLMAHHQK